MTSGLRWWHNVCREVRENARACAAFDEGRDPGDTQTKKDGTWVNCDESEFVEDHVTGAVAEWDGQYPGTGTPSKSLKETELKFLRTQWMAAYRKARS